MNRQQKIEMLVAHLGSLYQAKNWQIALAESCSGGGLAYFITQMPGSSAWLKYSLVTYTNEAKQVFLGVSDAILERDTAVSHACALAMLDGLDKTCVRLAVTGYTGPEGQNVGQVFIAYAPPYAAAQVCAFHFLGNRAEIQEQVIFEALKILIDVAWDWQSSEYLSCFFALGLDEHVLQTKLIQQAIQYGFSHQDLEPMTNLHLTLSHYAKQNQNDITKLLHQGDSLQGQVKCFELGLSTLLYFDRADTWAFGIDEMPPLLQTMVNFFAAPHFIPHVSLSKRCRLQQPEAKLSFLIPWQIKAYGLYISFHGIFYKAIKRWHLEEQI